VTVEVAAHAEIGVRNSQPEGIGRVVALGDLVAWNNLGRNIVFADRDLRPVSVFARTMFPDDDELSQYDLDIHAILEVPETAVVLTLNHLGWVRAFHRSDLVRARPVSEVQPAWTAMFAADVERSVVAGSYLVGSRPRSDGAQGVVVSGPIEAPAGRTAIGADVAGQQFGEVTALGVVSGAGDPLVALGGKGRVALVACPDGTIGRPRWEVDVNFRTAALVWDGRLLWAAGSAITAGPLDDYDWDQLTGGGYAALDPSDGAAVVTGRLPDDVAWGTGGVPVVFTEAGPVAVGRTGCLHLVHATEPTRSRSTAPLAHSSLGIAHAAAAGGRLLYGFNRGGYRLHVDEDRAPSVGVAKESESPTTVRTSTRHSP
jgi:hypothetical protein